MAYDTAPKKKFAEDYIDVAERIRAWYEAWPNGRIETRIISHSDSRVVVEARAYRGSRSDSGPDDELGFVDDRPAGTGHSAMQIPGTTPFTRGSELENCETSAVGRALVMAGLPSKKVASGDEIRAKSSPTSSDDAVVKAAVEAFDPSPEVIEWRDAINGATSANDLAAVAEQIGSSKLDAAAKRYLATFYNVRKADFA